nr:Ail/Lom family outer membrane beta-barrel protein [Escherichia coli]
MRKLYAAILSAAICLTVSGAPAWASEQQATLSAGYLHARTNAPGSDNLNGINVKYRYEFTDTLGLVTSFSYAGDKNRQLTRYSDTRWHEDSVRNRWFSVMAGPSVRVNEWFSAYAMAGVAYSRVSTFSGDYLRVTDNKGKTHDVLTGSDDGRHSDTSLATDTLGLVTSFSYAGDKNRQLTRYSDTRWHEDSVRNRWFSVMAGPSVRVNEWFSAYAMAGVAYSRVSTFSGDYLRVTDNKGKTHDVLTGSDDGRHSDTSLAWGAGVQFNPTESVAIDIAYEGSGSGDWRTDGFIVGVGYKF